VRVADQRGQFVIARPRVVMCAGPLLCLAFQDDDDLGKAQRPEIRVGQASGAPLAQQVMDGVSYFGLFFARCPFPSASAAALG
jgi:hypothetical protein